MKPITRTVFLLAAALVVTGVVFRQQSELYRLRAMVAELTSLPREEAATSTVINPLPADIEELRRDAAEIHRLRDEIAELRREKVEASALQARIDNLTRDASAILNQWPFGDFNYGAANPSPLVLQASSLAQSSPEEAARWVAALPPGIEQGRAALAVLNHWTGTDPAAAAAWTTQFPEGPLREQAMSFVARGWGLHDWNATAGWPFKVQ